MRRVAVGVAYVGEGVLGCSRSWEVCGSAVGIKEGAWD